MAGLAGDQVPVWDAGASEWRPGTRVTPTQLTDGLAGKASATHAASHAAGGTDVLTPAAIGAIPTTEKGAASGVAGAAA